MKKDLMKVIDDNGGEWIFSQNRWMLGIKWERASA
jgi:hypothetical protein